MMGVDYRAVSGYGFILSDWNDSVADIAERAGFDFDPHNQYDDVEDAKDDFDPYEFYEWLCQKYGVTFATAGNAYDGDVYALIGVSQSSDLFGFEEASKYLIEVSIDDELNSKLERMLSDLGLEKKIGYYTGLYIY